jgi:prepilin-type N-terminal cleavage/methylation domain-containing protein
MISRGRPRPGRGGFTLIEVTLALAILAFGLVSALLAREKARDVAFVARNLKLARLLGGNLLAEIQSGLREDLIDGSAGDFFDEGYPEFDWTVAIGEESVAAAEDYRDAESLSGYYAEREASRVEAKAAGEEIPPDPWTVVAIRVSYPTLTEERGVFVLHGRVKTAVLEGDFEALLEEATEGEGGDPGAGSEGGGAGGAAAVGGKSR